MTRTPDPMPERPPGSGFPPSARLHTPRDFKQTFEQGRRHHGRLFRLHARFDDTATVARLGVSVSKRVDKRAVGRNRIKRQARECFRRIRAELPPGDYVLVARHEAAGATPAQLRADLARLFEHLASLKRPGATGTMSDSASSATAPAGPRGSDPTAD